MAMLLCAAACGGQARHETASRDLCEGRAGVIALADGVDGNALFATPAALFTETADALVHYDGTGAPEAISHLPAGSTIGAVARGDAGVFLWEIASRTLRVQGDPTPLVEGVRRAWAFEHALLLDTDANVIFRVPLDTGIAAPLAKVPGPIWSIAANETQLVYSRGKEAEVWRVDLATGETQPIPIADGVGPIAVALRGDDLVVARQGLGVVQVSSSGTTPLAPLNPLEEVRDLRATKSAVYVTARANTAARTLRISDHVSELWSAGPESDVYPLFAFEQGAAWIGRSDPNACQTCADIPDLTPTLYLSCEE